MKHSFQYSTVINAQGTDVSPGEAASILASMQSHPSWDEVCVFCRETQFPLLNLSWHTAHGFLVQCFEAAESRSDFLVVDEPLSPPTIDIILGGQTQEQWPRQLFVPIGLAREAMEFFLELGRQSPNLRWVRIDRFPRRTIWVGRRGQLAWERKNSRRS
jgi:hypothetical protein